MCDPAMGSGAFLVETCRQLGDELVKAWHVHNAVPKLPPDEDELLHARRLIAQRASTAWTVTRWPWTWPSSRSGWPRSPRTTRSRSSTTACGPAIRWWGCRRSRSPRSTGRPAEEKAKKRGRVLLRRPDRRVDQAGDGVPAENSRGTRRGTLRASAPATRRGRRGSRHGPVRRRPGRRRLLLGREGQSPRGAAARTGLAAGQVPWPGGKMEDRQPLAEAVRQLRSGDRPVTPFHWEIEFPEVFGGTTPALMRSSAIRRLREEHADQWQRGGYIDWLKQIHEESHGNADLVAHFFRRAFNRFVRMVASALSPRTRSARETRGQPVCGGFVHTAEPSSRPGND